MQSRQLIKTLFVLSILSVAPTLALGEDNAAIDYFYAASELQAALPDHVALATTDNPLHGFGRPLTKEHLVFVRRKETVSALARFDRATSILSCSWGRYGTPHWSDAGLNDRLHRVARVALLRARLRYESGSWEAGNQEVERVRVLARHLALQARPYEHQLFMIENMATGTAAAYLLQMPHSALADLAERDRRVGLLNPMSQMMDREAARIRELADLTKAGSVALEYLVECVSPYIESIPGRAPFGGDPAEAITQAQNLATLLDKLSPLVDSRDVVSTERRIRELCAQHAPNDQAAAAAFDWASYEYRENSQAICRSLIFRSVADELQHASTDLTTLVDPYGDGELELHETEAGVILYSDLIHSSRIDFRLGMAGGGDSAANKTMSRSDRSTPAELKPAAPR